MFTLKDVNDFLYKLMNNNPKFCIDATHGYNDIIIQQLFIKLYGQAPYRFYLGQEGYWSNIYKNNENLYDDILKHAFIGINKEKTTNKIIKQFKNCIVYPNTNHCWIFTENYIIENATTVYSKYPYLEKELVSCIVKPDIAKCINWVSVDTHGYFNTFKMDIKSKGDIKNNYNDDLPHDKVKEILNKEESSIIILHGKCGTGKTNYIRNLILENDNLDFYWLDQSMFNYVNSTSFISFIKDHKNSVFILEDCEALLLSRDTSYNTLLSSLLNISDGMLGDSLNLKFICTFNTNLSNIDTALLRKGRLKLKYEFKDLEVDKVVKLFEELNIDTKYAKSMPLCDVYNYYENIGTNENKNKMGFV